MGNNCAGVDWAADKHDVRVCDGAGEELLSATFAHDENGLRALCRQLVRLRVALVAIERPDGLLVERLLDAGLRVLPLHPNQVAATRARFRVSGGKSDRFDAFVLAVCSPGTHSQSANGPRSGSRNAHEHCAGSPNGRRTSPACVIRPFAGEPCRSRRSTIRWHGCRWTAASYR